MLTDSEIKKNLGSSNPLTVLDQWLKSALKITQLKEPWAMLLSTSYKDKPSSRVVLLKQFKQGKLIFYTNYSSQKGKDIKNNPQVAVNFYWSPLDRQVRITGRVKKSSRKLSLSYWKTRSRDSQLSQWISKQSQKVSSRKELEALKRSAEKKFYKKTIPCPKHWGGYILQIKTIEFWKNQDHRLHDRFLFEKRGKGWKKQRLFP